MKKMNKKWKKVWKRCAAMGLNCILLIGVEPISAEEFPTAEEYVIEPETMPENEPMQDAADYIQSAVDEETDLIITINEDMEISKTIYIPSGRMVQIMPAESVNVTLFGKNGFHDSFFLVEEGAQLILGREETETGTIHMDHSDLENDEWLVKGAGEVVLLKGVELAGVSEAMRVADTMAEYSFEVVSGETVIGEDDLGTVAGNLADAVIEIVGGENLTYNGNPHTPTIEVWMGNQMLMRGFDYDVIYDHHVNAGTAGVVISATGLGLYTGTGRSSFEILPAIPQFTVENQSVVSGGTIADLTVPVCGIGVLSESVNGDVYWSASEGGAALPTDMMLSGTDGDTMQLFWTFCPEEDCTNYQSVSGYVTLTFVMPDVPQENGLSDENLWNEIGFLSNSSSSSGVTSGEDTVEDTSGENLPVSSEHISASDLSIQESGTGQSKETAGKENITTMATATKSTTATGKATTGTKGSVTISRSNPRTGDEAPVKQWILTGTTAGITAAALFLELDRRIFYKKKKGNK